MNWRPIAHSNAVNGLRSGGAIALLLVLLVAFAGLAGFLWRYGDGTVEQFYSLAVPMSWTVVPLLSMILGYRVVIGAKRSGTLTLVMSMPHSRLDLAVGSLVGRSIVLGIPLLIALVTAGLVVTVGLEGINPIGYLTYIILTMLLAIAFLSLAIGLSMSAETTIRVTALALGSYLLFAVMWSTAVQLVWLVIYRFQADAMQTRPDWTILLELLSPVEAYRVILDATIDIDLSTVADLPEAPWFATSSVALFILLLWVVVPITIGYLRFRDSSLI